MLIDLQCLRGLRFPDAHLIRMFFKEGLQSAPGRALELGCGSGNNLLLLRSFGWSVSGVDIAPDALAAARHNLGDELPLPDLRRADLAQELPQFEPGFDLLMLPNVINYLPRVSCEARLRECAQLLRPGGLFFITARTPADWRYGRGECVEPEGFVLDTAVTGELGALNVFYDREALTGLVRDNIGVLREQVLLHQRFENLQRGEIVINDDLILWGRRS